MDVIYAAEKRTIAELLENHVQECVRPEDIKVTENPSETGSFFIGWRLRRYVLSPAGEIAAERGQRASAVKAGMEWSGDCR
jgi:hypothetical protein